jgi:hypothetical protein
MPAAAGARPRRAGRRETIAADTDRQYPSSPGGRSCDSCGAKPAERDPSPVPCLSTGPLAGVHACLAQRFGYAIRATYVGVVIAVVTAASYNALTSP